MGTTERERVSGTVASGERHAAPDGFERRTSRTPILLLALIVLGAFFAIGYTMFTRSVVYYKTPTEVLAMPGEHVRLSGRVVSGSITRDVQADAVSFEVTDGHSTVPVRFVGPAPDTLKDGADAVAEGALGRDGTFRAEKLFAKCPSKFQSKAGR